jgi:hypothetical protein
MARITGAGQNSLSGALMPLTPRSRREAAPRSDGIAAEAGSA